MPKFNVTTYLAYNINKFSFYTKSKDFRSIMQNSGIKIEGGIQDLTLDIPETPFFAIHVPTSYEENDTDDVHVIHYDHEKDIWKN